MYTSGIFPILYNGLICHALLSSYIGVSSLAGAEIKTFFAPPFR